MNEQWKAPERIYLQVSNADHGISVTWCRERLESTDVKYVRLSYLDQAEKKKQQIGRLNAWLEQAERDRDSHLDALCDIAELLGIPKYENAHGVERFDANNGANTRAMREVAIIVNSELDR